MRQLSSFSLLFLAAACGPRDFGSLTDAGSTGTPAEVEINVDSSGTQQCPGNLFLAASYHTATCTHADERCLSNDTGGTAMPIVCSCNAPDNGTDHWSCAH